MNIYQRLLVVMNEVGYVQKQGENSFHKYSYAREADFVRAVRPAFLKNGILMFPVAQKTTTMLNVETANYLATVEMTFRFQNADDVKDFIDVPVVGSGTDKGDKACMKAMTAAKKYCLALALLIETGDDPEADVSVDKQAAEKPRTKKSKINTASSEELETATGAEFNGFNEQSNGSALVAKTKISSFKSKSKSKGGW